MKPVLKRLTWKDVREDVRKVNAELADIIDQIDPPKSYTLYVAEYPYGSYFIKNGEFLVPDIQGNLSPLKNNQVSSRIREDLSYNLGSSPTNIILENSVEVFLDLNKVTVPYSTGCLGQGKIFSVSKILNPKGFLQPAFLWNMTAGVRSTFMLANISEKRSHDRLRKILNIKIDKPKGLFDHWYIFKEIAQKGLAEKAWKTRMLFFSKIWFESLDDVVWRKFKLFILEQSWKMTEALRAQFYYQVIMDFIKKQKNLKVDSFVDNLVRHLVFIAMGVASGFSPMPDNSKLPFELIKKVYLDVYRLDTSDPIVMFPKVFDFNSDDKIYCSLSFPNSINFSLKSNEQSSNLSDLVMIKMLLNKYFSSIDEGGLNLSGVSIYNLSDKVNFEYFHSNNNNYSGIKNSSSIPDGDSSMYSATQDFPASNVFFRGCVRVSKQKNS